MKNTDSYLLLTSLRVYLLKAGCFGIVPGINGKTTVNFHINRGDFLLKIRGGPGPWTRSMGWSMHLGPCFVYVHFRRTAYFPGNRVKLNQMGIV